ncbi:MAG: hypothetical protein MJK15_00795 [Colwellia sp.]|nr:hypothetical protein [Colwellia sp.]
MTEPHFLTKKIDWILNPKQAELEGDELPTGDDFKIVWRKLTHVQRKFVAASLQVETLAEWVGQLEGLTYGKIYKFLDTGRLVMRAVIIGRMMSMPSDVAKATYLEVLMKNEKSRNYHRNDIAMIVTSDKEHLQELAGKIMTTGDGKRQILKELIAYGMQTKKLDDAKISEATGEVLQPAVYTLADPRIALISLQEMNKMDHEYAEAASSTSSIESQADRIKRLKAQPIGSKDLLNRVNSASQMRAEELGGVSKKINANAYKPLNLTVDKV